MPSHQAISRAKHSSARRLLWKTKTYIKDWKKRSIWLWLSIIGLAFLIALIITDLRYNTEVHVNFSFIDQNKSYLVKTEGCRIPHMDPFHESIRKYIFNQPNVQCNNGLPPLVESNLTSIHVLEESALSYEISDLEYLKCCYKPFWRVAPEEPDDVDEVQFAEECTPFSGATNINNEFIAVECFYSNDSIYKDYFSFVPTKRTKHQKSTDKLNILILGLDSVSRLNFHRQLQNTKETLELLKPVEFLGYTKVGDNTFPNFIAMLTGMDKEELVDACWQDPNKRFDKCPFIWKEFQQNGFLTAFAEDAAWMGAFNYEKRGFFKQPTDYYWGPFSIASEDGVGNQRWMSIDQCIGSRETHTVLLDYIDKFSKKMMLTRNNYFGLFWMSSLSHDTLNKPKTGDEAIGKFIRKLYSSGIFNNTILFLLSDHGMRYGPIRTTYQGSLEEKLPFLYIYLPEWYKKQNPTAYSNLVINSQRLTTPYDIHETLLELVDPYNLQSVEDIAIGPGQSLFQQIPTTRTCKQAGISPHYCTCQRSVEVATNDLIVQNAAKFMVNFMNKMLKGTQCAKIELDSVWYARKHSHKNVEDKENYFEDYTVTIRGTPGGGLFEATLRKERTDEGYYLSLTEHISRINYYGNQSSCVSHYLLKLYCYCV